jgi:hypothetical protein
MLFHHRARGNGAAPGSAGDDHEWSGSAIMAVPMRRNPSRA